MGLDALPWNSSCRGLQARSEWLRLHQLVAADWPELSDQRLLETLSEWLAPFVEGISRRKELERIDLAGALKAQFSSRQLTELDRLAPTWIVVPSGSRIPLSYTTNPEPVLAVRLQEMFGQASTPTIAGGRVHVVLHLLSPASRPLAVTKDLTSFWQQTYPVVRTQMRARYPKHYWPEDPMKAAPTKRTKRRQEKT